MGGQRPNLRLRTTKEALKSLTIKIMFAMTKISLMKIGIKSHQVKPKQLKPQKKQAFQHNNIQPKKQSCLEDKFKHFVNQ